MTVELHGGPHGAELVFNRPERLNAFDSTALVSLREIISELEADPPRALLVRGAGRAFSAGRDLREAGLLDADVRGMLAHEVNPLVLRLAALRCPTLAAVHGPALGLGLGLALACDILLVSPSAQLGSPFARLGAVLDSGAHHFLYHRIGPHRSLELIYSGRLLSGAEALAWGIANQLHPDDELFDMARRFLESVAAGPTLAFQASKSLLGRMTAGEMGLADVLADEAVLQGNIAQSHDYVEGMTAFRQRRAPVFTGG